MKPKHLNPPAGGGLQYRSQIERDLPPPFINVYMKLNDVVSAGIYKFKSNSKLAIFNDCWSEREACMHLFKFVK